MSAAVIIWAGARKPEAYVLELGGADDTSDVDLSTVTDAVLRARDPSGAETEWEVTSDWDPDAGVLTLTHIFAEVDSEVTKPGMWSVYAELTVPQGIVRSKPRAVVVRERFAVVP